MAGLLSFVAVKALTRNALNASKINGKVPVSELPASIAKIEEYATRSAFPATGEGSTLYIAVDEGTEWMYGSSGYYCVGNKGYECLVLDTTSIHTIAQLKTLVDEINDAGRHVLFDLSGFSSAYSRLANAKICAIDFYNSGSNLCIVDLIGGYVYDKGSAYTGSQYIENYCSSYADSYAYEADTVGFQAVSAVPTTALTCAKVGDVAYCTANSLYYYCSAISGSTYTWLPLAKQIALTDLGLTDAEKEIARTNIGASSIDFTDDITTYTGDADVVLAWEDD